jgi:3',5'-cyclic AMP phosphodiesterase CpdA
MNKRFFGWLSWVRRRRSLHLPAVLGALAEDLKVLAADHIVVTGDLTNIALPGEFSQVAEWLGTLGSPANISVIPGNHDAYVAVPWAHSLAKWQPFMAGEDGEAGDGPESFPYVRYRGPLAIVGLSSSLRGIARRKRLVDAAAFRQVIAEAGAELVLHGHDHTFGHEVIEGRDGPVPVLGIPSASAAASGKKPLAHYQLYSIAKGGNGWAVEVMARGYDPASGRFTETRSYGL